MKKVETPFRMTVATVIALLVACTSLKYQDDVGFLVSAQADSPEFPVYVNKHLCTDMEGHQGLCSKRLSSKDDLTLSFDPQSYAYLITFRCSMGVEPVFPLNVPSGQSGSVTIPSKSFASLREFICEGNVSPQDRSVPTSALFSIHVIVFDANYTLREGAYLKADGKNTYLVLGEYARTAWVFDEGKWTKHWKDPVVQIHGDPKLVKAYSESFAMRFNYFNMSDADGGML